MYLVHVCHSSTALRVLSSEGIGCYSFGQSVSVSSSPLRAFGQWKVRRIGCYMFVIEAELPSTCQRCRSSRKAGRIESARMGCARALLANTLNGCQFDQYARVASATWPQQCALTRRWPRRRTGRLHRHHQHHKPHRLLHGRSAVLPQKPKRASGCDGPPLSPFGPSSSCWACQYGSRQLPSTGPLCHCRK